MIFFSEIIIARENVSENCELVGIVIIVQGLYK